MRLGSKRSKESIVACRQRSRQATVPSTTRNAIAARAVVAKRAGAVFDDGLIASCSSDGQKAEEEENDFHGRGNERLTLGWSMIAPVLRSQVVPQSGH